ncbi:hypothetical protein [Streptomyces sp. NPDC001815]|uniref:hypothetical protein n=1 Tax=Streptomyces sp. NPDC001815 TaxID=3154526 RepID=UPI003330502A
MAEPIRVETDLIPAGLYDSSQDWTGLTVTRQLARPLFTEGPERTLCSGLLGVPQRIDDTRWDFTVDPAARWSDDRPLHAVDTARHMVNVSRQAGPFAWLMSFIAQIQPISATRLRVTTRRPFGNLPALLANPVFGPRHQNPAITSGAYTLPDETPGELRLRSVGPWPDATYVLSSSARHGQELFDRRAVDITCPTTFPVPQWARSEDYPELRVDDLDIVVALMPPAGMAPSLGQAIGTALDRRALAREVHGAIEPIGSFTHLWCRGASVSPPQEAHDLFREWVRDPIPLVFPDFSPNREMARALAEQIYDHTGLTVLPKAIGYQSYLTELSSTHREAFRLVLMAAPWPAPVAPLVPFTHRPLAQTSDGQTSAFKDAVFRALAADDPQEHLRLTARAERLLAATGQICLFGRLRSATRLRVRNYVSPPSGWVDLSACEPLRS